MPLTPREAFKLGFLCKCADDALSASESRLLMEKAADFLSWLGGKAESGAGTMLNKGMGLAVGLPVAAGIGGGYLLNKATEDEVDEEDIQKQELIAELKHWARRAREQAKMKQLATQ